MAYLVQARPSGRPLVQVDILKGFKSDIRHYEPFVQYMADTHHQQTRVQGYENPGSNLDFLPDYRQTAREFFCSPYDGRKTNIHRIAGAHSLGAFLLLELLCDDESAAVIAQDYDAIAMFNPFTGDKYHDYWLCRKYSEVVGRDKPAGKTLLERPFVKVKDEAYEIPSHRQSVMLHDESVSLHERIEQLGGLSRYVRDMPILIIGGSYDPVCNNKKTKAIADLIGADYEEFKTGHNAILDSIDARQRYAQWSGALRYHPRIEPRQQVYPAPALDFAA